MSDSWVPVDWDEVEWDALLAEWSAELDGDRWITLAEAEVETGMSKSALRAWYRTGQIRSRMVDGPNGPQRLVPQEAVRLRAALARRRRPAVKLDDEVERLSGEVKDLRAQVERLTRRLEALGA
jgi:transposase